MSTRKPLAVAVSLAALASVPARMTGADEQPAGESGPTKSGITLIDRIDGFEDWVTCVALSADGSRLAAGSYDQLTLIDAADRRSRTEVNLGKGYVRSLLFFAGGGSIAAGCYQSVILIDVVSGKALRTFKGPLGQVTGVALSPDQRRLAAAGEDGSLWIWALESAEGSRFWHAENSPLQSVEYSTDGQRLLVARGDPERPTRPGGVTILDARTAEPVYSMDQIPRTVTQAVFSKDGQQVLAACLDQNVYILSPGKEDAARAIARHARPINAIAVTADNRFAVTGGGGSAHGKNEMLIWNPHDGRVLYSGQPHTDRISSLHITPDGMKLVAGSYDKSITLWSIADLSGANPATE